MREFLKITQRFIFSGIYKQKKKKTKLDKNIPTISLNYWGRKQTFLLTWREAFSVVGVPSPLRKISPLILHYIYKSREACAVLECKKRAPRSFTDDTKMLNVGWFSFWFEDVFALTGRHLRYEENFGEGNIFSCWTIFWLEYDYLF